MVAIAKANTNGLLATLEDHRGFVQRGQASKLGRLVKIVLAELPKDVQLAISDVERATEGRTLDWFERGPMLGLSPGERDLLVLSQVKPLPDKPVPGWVPPEVTQQQIEEAVARTGQWTPPDRPKIPQRPEDRGCSRVTGTTLLVFEPVHEILYRPLVTQTWGSIKADTNLYDGRKMAFVWDIAKGEAFFCFGRFSIEK